MRRRRLSSLLNARRLVISTSLLRVTICDSFGFAYIPSFITSLLLLEIQSVNFSSFRFFARFLASLSFFRIPIEVGVLNEGSMRLMVILLSFAIKRADFFPSSFITVFS